ncbi:MAG: hypothetical protein R6U96_10010 [Promethearchaeia archaeon]
MRIKTFERLLGLKEIYELCDDFIESDYEVSDHSFYDQSKLIISAINLEENSILISGTTNSEHERTHLALKIIPTEKLHSILSKNQSVENSVDEIGAAIKEITEKIEPKDIFPFTKLNGAELVEKETNKKIINHEKKLFNQILEEVGQKFNYQDDFIKFPFSIAAVEGSWELWEPIYEPYLREIEKNLDEIQNYTFDVYKNYGFSYPREFYQRVFDLMITEETNVKGFDPSELFTGVITERMSKIAKIKNAETKKKPKIKGTHFLWMTFVYAYKEAKPMSIIKLLKLNQEVKRFARQYKKRLKDKYIEISPRLILISLFGFDNKVKEHLKNNRFRQGEEVIPIFVLPAIDGNLWHNFREDRKLSRADRDRKKKSKKIMEIYDKMSNTSSFRKSQAEEAREKYKNLVARQKKGELDTLFLTDWAKILEKDNVKSLLNLEENREKIKDIFSN